MTVCKTSPTLEVLDILPGRFKREIATLIKSSNKDFSALSEIRIVAIGVSTLVIDGKNCPLISRCDREEVSEILMKLCGNSIYAYSDTISLGYIPMGNGIRVGIAGRARYENGHIVGVSDIRSLIFRLPSGTCDFAEELVDLWQRENRPNMLICSSPTGGKTTALRSVAKILSSGADARRVVVVDERCEFIEDDYKNCSCDLLRGYGRGRGIEVAYRTMSAEVIIVDEIATEDEAFGVLSGLGSGTKIIATVHAQNLSDLNSRTVLYPILQSKMFSLAIFIEQKDGKRTFTYKRI